MELVGHLFAARPKPCIQRTPRHHAGPQPPQSSKRHPLTEAKQERDSVTSQTPPLVLDRVPAGTAMAPPRFHAAFVLAEESHS